MCLPQHPSLFRVGLCHVSAVCTSMCLLMTCHYYPVKSSDEASETMLVNLKEFNKMATHGSERELQLSITGYYIAHKKTLDNMQGRNTTSYRLQTHKCSKTYIQNKNSSKHKVFQMCAIVLFGWIEWSSFTESVWASWLGQLTEAPQALPFIHGGKEKEDVSGWKHVCEGAERSGLIRFHTPAWYTERKKKKRSDQVLDARLVCTECV